MADVRKLAPFILKWEGGFVNDPDDLGGATNMGVTIGTYEAYCRKKGYSKPTVERLKNLTKEEWTEILKTMYWDRWKADEIKSQSVADILVDWVWASGAHGIKIPQRLLGVSVDGIVGPKTIAAAATGSDSDTLKGIQSKIALNNLISLQQYNQQEKTNILLSHILVQLSTPAQKDVLDREYQKFQQK